MLKLGMMWMADVVLARRDYQAGLVARDLVDDNDV